MNGRKGKSGQIAIFLVLILAGLVLMFALNVDIFTSARSKIRLQNAADASALALARWQGATLNLIGDLNLAHLAAVCQSNRNAIAGIVALQPIAFVAPLGRTRQVVAQHDLLQRGTGTGGDGLRGVDDTARLTTEPGQRVRQASHGENGSIEH